jgi:hypothetical protein
MPEPFHFYSELHLVRLLGLKAKNPAELLEHIRHVPTSSIYYHTHRFLQQHHYLTPEPPNDFAYWVTNILSLDALGELLASIDIIHFTDIEALRKSFVTVLSSYIENGKFVVDCEPGAEFHFMSCVTVIMPTPYVAHTVEEFVEALSKVSISSLYFHMFEARLRLGGAENDFSRWFKGIGREQIAHEISHLDPYTITLEGLRARILEAALGRPHVPKTPGVIKGLREKLINTLRKYVKHR